MSGALLPPTVTGTFDFDIGDLIGSGRRDFKLVLLEAKLYNPSFYRLMNEEYHSNIPEDVDMYSMQFVLHGSSLNTIEPPFYLVETDPFSTNGVLFGNADVQFHELNGNHYAILAIDMDYDDSEDKYDERVLEHDHVIPVKASSPFPRGLIEKAKFLHLVEKRIAVRDAQYEPMDKDVPEAELMKEVHRRLAEYFTVQRDLCLAISSQFNDLDFEMFDSLKAKHVLPEHHDLPEFSVDDDNPLAFLQRGNPLTAAAAYLGGSDTDVRKHIRPSSINCVNLAELVATSGLLTGLAYLTGESPAIGSVFMSGAVFSAADALYRRIRHRTDGKGSLTGIIRDVYETVHH